MVATGKFSLISKARARFVEEIVFLRGLYVQRFLKNLKRTLLLLLLRSRDLSLRFRSIKNIGLFCSIIRFLNNIKLCLRLLNTFQFIMWLVPLVILFPGCQFLFGVPVIFQQCFKHSLLNLILKRILINFVSNFIGV